MAWIQTVTSSSAQGTPGGVPGSSVSAVPGDQPYVAVIGGGPAGLIAAERMAIAGARVEVFEHKRSVGRKFLLAGRGGLNITHGEPIDDMLVRFGEARTFLEPAIRAFSPADLRCWSAGLGEPTFLGTSDRVFPQSFRATPLLRSWLQRLNEVGVEFRTGHRWTGWTKNGANLFETPDGSLLTDQADATIFALGGASWPRVGSDGGWAEPFRSAGIAVHDLEPANCGVLANWSSVLREKFAGQPIKNAVFSCGGTTARGDGIITESGIEGGPIYALGPAVRRELADSGTAILRVDLHPDLALSALIRRLSKRRAKVLCVDTTASAVVSTQSTGPEEEVAHGDEEESSVEAGESGSHAFAGANHPGEGGGDELALEERLDLGHDVEHQLRFFGGCSLGVEDIGGELLHGVALSHRKLDRHLHFVVTVTFEGASELPETTIRSGLGEVSKSDTVKVGGVGAEGVREHDQVLNSGVV